ncbi:GpE family phage tail protein [Comamonas koreensis]|nr:GpE family phage tail protein [Comamonas koreensis]
MADVAYLFHWPLESLERMDLADLMRWHGLAVQRHNAAHALPE